MSGLTEEQSFKCFDGIQKVISHQSTECQCKMTFSIYLPTASKSGLCPTLIYLPGMTATEQTLPIKGGFHRIAEEYGMIVTCPDSSPRGCNIEGEDDSWEFGSGVGFYVDATEEKWKTNYRMYSYVTKEFLEIITKNFPVNPDKIGITGHSMGGHGAMVLGLKNPHLFKSISAFAPICNPVNSPWGQTSFSGYLGPDKLKWKEYDSLELVGIYKGPHREILLEQGTEDQWMNPNQLLYDDFRTACSNAKNVNLIFSLREGYDHKYYFVSTFIGEHIKFHMKNLS